jgi:Holliday junction resolvase RusA-like endonuclease
MIELWVVGKPRPQGSFRAVMIGDRPQLIPDGSTESKREHKEWRAAVTAAAKQYLVDNPTEPLDEPLRVFITLWMPLPESDPYRVRHATTPDWDKLARSTCDSLTDSGLICNDSRIFDGRVTSYYARPDELTGARIRIWPCGAQEAEDREALKLAARQERSPQLALNI